MKLTFRGHRIYCSICLGETNTLHAGTYIIVAHTSIGTNEKVIRGEKIRSRKAIFFYFGDLRRLNR